MRLVDASLPKPFWLLAKWPSPESGAQERQIVPLDLAVSVGGFFKEYLHRLAAQGACIRVHGASFREAAGGVRRDDAKLWLSRYRMNPIVLDHISQCEVSETFECDDSTVFIDAESAEIPAQATARDWLNELHNEFALEKAPSELDELLEAYSREIPEARYFPWEGLRFFGGYLRRKGKTEWALAFQKSWSKAHALFSAQDEIGERTSLAAGECVLNPTFQVVRSRSVDVFWRDGQRVAEKEIGVCEAALIDELMEAGRVHARSILAAAAANLHGDDVAGLANAYAALVRDGIVFEGRA